MGLSYLHRAARARAHLRRALDAAPTHAAKALIRRRLAAAGEPEA